MTSVGETMSLSSGSYTIYRAQGVMCGWDAMSNACYVSNCTFGASDQRTITIRPAFEKVLITSSGLQYVGTDNTYFSVKKSGTMVMRNGNNALGIDASGPFVISNGMRYKISTTGTSTSVD